MSMYKLAGLHVATTTGTVLLLFTILIGVIWSWTIAIAFIISVVFFTLCCLLSYYGRCSFSFNNLPDTNQSSFLAFVTNRLPKQEPSASNAEPEQLQPFTFKENKTDQEAEDRRVRALLRQVSFPDTF